MNFYIIFVAFFGLSSLITGYISPFINHFGGFVLTAFVSYWATKILVSKYNALNCLIYTLLGMGIINSVVTIGQFLYIPIFNMIPGLLHIQVDEEFADMYAIGRDFFGLTVPGIMVNDVYNGYFTSVVAVLMLYFHKNGLRPLYFVPWAITMLASFYIQERGPFYLAGLCSLYLVFITIKTSQSSLKYLYLMVFVIVIIYGSSILLEYMLSGSSRFALGMDGTRRDVIYDRSFEILQDNFIFGGWYYLSHTYHVAPHNVLINAIFYGGIFGFISICILLWKQIKHIVQTIIKGLSADTYYLFVIGLAFLVFTGNSFLHNKSVVNGDALLWLLWGAYIAKYNKFTCVFPNQ